MADEVQEVLRTSYSTEAFDLAAALSGALVGLIQDVSQLSSANISDNTGKLQKADGLTHYYVIIDGVTCWVNETGKVQHCVDGTKIGKTLVIVKANMVSTTGSHQQTTRSGGESYQDILAISSLEVRDTFAIYALQGLLQHTNNPESFDDASILSMCGAAYKWAQGMMQASADKRALIAKESGDDPGGEDEPASGQTRRAVDVSDGTTTEKLLQNLIIAVDDLTATWKNVAEKGIAIVGSPEEEALPVAVESTIKEMPKVVIDGDPLATQEDIDGLRTHVTNAKDEIIEEMPESSSFPTDYAKQETLTNVQSTVNDIAEAVIDQ